MTRGIQITEGSSRSKRQVVVAGHGSGGGMFSCRTTEEVGLMISASGTHIMRDSYI